MIPQIEKIESVLDEPVGVFLAGTSQGAWGDANAMVSALKVTGP
jgi:hypothetical protein